MHRDFLEVARQETVFKNPNAVLEIIILPFEDAYTIESERLQLCSSCFCYVDVETDTVKSIPFCIWEKFKNPVMREIAKKYNKEGYTQGLLDSRPHAKVKKESVTID